MKNILFISQRFNDYCKANYVNTSFIIDYFDIEAQKILNCIGYRIKMCPQIINNDANPGEYKKYELIYDLDIHDFITYNKKRKMFGVVFSCQ